MRERRERDWSLFWVKAIGPTTTTTTTTTTNSMMMAGTQTNRCPQSEK